MRDSGKSRLNLHTNQGKTQKAKSNNGGQSAVSVDREKTVFDTFQTRASGEGAEETRATEFSRNDRIDI
jgi:hypothetical protein